MQGPLPEDAIRRNQFPVARTRMDKSTLMHHVVTHLMQEKAAGRNDDAIIVADPHADPVKALLEQVPESILDSVYLIDLADEKQARASICWTPASSPIGTAPPTRWCGWPTACGSSGAPDAVNPGAHRKSLHEYNCHPDTDEDEQLTILDGSRMLLDRRFRNRVLLRVANPYIVRWWGGVFMD